MLEVAEGRGMEEEADEEEEGGEDPPRGVGSRSLWGEGGRDPSVTASPTLYIHIIMKVKVSEGKCRREIIIPRECRRKKVRGRAGER